MPIPHAPIARPEPASGMGGFLALPNPVGKLCVLRVGDGVEAGGVAFAGDARRREGA